MSTNNPMTQERLDAIQERVDAATGGPWDCYGTGAHEVFDAGEYADGDLGEIVAPVVTKLSDAVFIAHARTDIPALLAEVERLRALTTVDEDMVERAARAFYEYPAPNLDVRTYWDRINAVRPEAADLYRLNMACAIQDALKPQEGTA